MLDIDNELRMLRSGMFEPRRMEIATGDYGQIQLKTALANLNRSTQNSSSENSYQGNFHGIYKSASKVAEMEYSLGFPLERVRFFLRHAALGMLTCLKMRGTLEQVEFTVEVHKGGEEKLLDAAAYVDVSLGKPGVGLDAYDCAWLAQDFDLAQSILAVVNFHPEDTNAYGEARIAEMRSRIGLLIGNDKLVVEYLDQAKNAEGRGRLIQSFVECNQKLFNEGLIDLLKVYEKEEKRSQRDMGDYFKKKGLKNPPVHYWSIECMGAVLLGFRRGLELQIDHPFLPVEMLEGCV